MIDSSFLAPPNEVLDWRRVVLTSTASRNGVLDQLPAKAETIAEAIDMDAHSLSILLDALCVWDVVTNSDDTYGPGPNFPDEAEKLILNQHAQFMQRWGSQLDDRLSNPQIENHPPRPPGALGAWLGALGENAKTRAPEVLDFCFEQLPDAQTVLDLAGGHGEYGMEAARRGKQVTLFDLKEVIGTVSEWPSVKSSGMELFAGDVYHSRPDGQFDLVLCFGFSHTQPAGSLGELFSHLAGLTAPGGGIAVHTLLHNTGAVPAMFAVQMLLAGRGGDTHRLSDYAKWLTTAGFEAPHVHTLGDRSLLFARKL